MKSEAFYLLLLSFFFCVNMHGQSKEKCNSLIKKGIIASQKDKNEKALELFIEANTIASKNKWHEQECKSLNGLAITYTKMMEYGIAYDYYIKAYKIAVKYNLEEEKFLNNIGLLYEAEGNYKKAKEYYDKSYKIAKEKKSESIKSPILNLANLALTLNDPLLAQKYIKEALPYVKENFRDSISAHIMLGHSYLLLGNTKLSREKLHSVTYRLKDDIDYHRQKNEIQLYIIESYIKDLDYKMAIEYSNNLLLQYPDVEIKVAVFELVAQAYRGAKFFDLSLQYKDSLINANIKLNKIKNTMLFENSKVKFEIEKYKNQTIIHQKELASERKVFSALLLIAFASFIILLLLFKQKISKNKHKNILAIEQEKNVKLVLEKQITDTLLESELLKNELENKNKKLYSKELFLSDRNLLIEEITASLLKNNELLNDKKIMDNIKALKNHLKTDIGLDNFISHFEKVNSGFFTRLKKLHPNLNQNDIKFIAYVYMNLSVKEIAIVLHITVGACKKRKERIAAKMNIPKEKNIYSYISVI